MPNARVHAGKAASIARIRSARFVRERVTDAMDVAVNAHAIYV